jgi:hypothetical protein
MVFRLEGPKPDKPWETGLSECGRNRLQPKIPHSGKPTSWDLGVTIGRILSVRGYNCSDCRPLCLAIRAARWGYAMRQLGLFITGCMVLLFLMAGCAARPQDPKPARTTYTFIEPYGYIHAHNEKDPHTKIKLLDSWVPQNSDSALLPFAYYDYVMAYSSVSDYPKVIVYADKLLAMGTKIDLEGRLQTLVARAEAYRSGCSDNSFQTPEAYNEAKDAANQGLQTLGEWQKPVPMSDEEYRTSKSNHEMLFRTVSRLADLGMNGDNITNLCMPFKPDDR